MDDLTEKSKSIVKEVALLALDLILGLVILILLTAAFLTFSI